jgi:hypothetical protein
MKEAEWLAATDPWPLQVFLKKFNESRKLRLFTVACCRHVFAYGNGTLGNLLLANEAFADGLLGEQEFELLAEGEIEASPRPPDGPAQEVWDAIKSESTCPSRFSAVYSCDAAANALLPLSLLFNEDINSDELAKHPDAKAYLTEREYQTFLMRDIFGNPFRPVIVDPSWLTSTVVALAQGIYQERAFDRMPILADALQDAGCENEDILNHCRGEGTHVRGCWVVDLLLGKE